MVYCKSVPYIEWSNQFQREIIIWLQMNFDSMLPIFSVTYPAKLAAKFGEKSAKYKFLNL